MYRFLATDLDGTLLTSDKRISAATQSALVDAQERGLTVILASGRPLYGILPYCEQLQLPRFHGYIIAYNGSLIWDCAASRPLRQQIIPMELIPQLAAFATEGFNIMGYRGNSIVCEDATDPWGRHIAAINRMPYIAVESFVQAITEMQHKCLFTGAPRRLWHLERRLNMHFSGRLSSYRSEKFLLEVVPAGIDKAEALAFLLDRVGGSAGELICCGDGYNDLSMLRLAGLSCATRNAQKPVKEAAHYITHSCDQDGVAHVVRRYLAF